MKSRQGRRTGRFYSPAQRAFASSVTVRRQHVAEKDSLVKIGQKTKRQHQEFTTCDHSLHMLKGTSGRAVTALDSLGSLVSNQL